MAEPTRADSAKAATTGHKRPSAPNSRSSTRLSRRDGVAAGAKAGSAGSATAITCGASGTVRSARAIGPDCSGIGTDFRAAIADAASEKRRCGSSLSNRCSTSLKSAVSTSCSGQHQLSPAGDINCSGGRPVSSTSEETPRPCKSIQAAQASPRPWARGAYPGVAPSRGSSPSACTKPKSSSTGNPSALRRNRLRGFTSP